MESWVLFALVARRRVRQRREQVAIQDGRPPLFTTFRNKCLCGKELCTRIRMHHPRGKEMKRLTRAMGEVVVKRHLVAMGYDVDTRNTLWAQIADGADIRLAVCVHYHGGD